MSAYDRPAVVVLAAGGSHRLGEPKQLLRWQGEALLVRAVRLALAVGAPVHVVLGAHAQACEAELARHRLGDYTLLRHIGWQEGMGGSLAAGVRSMPEGTPGVLVLLVDQPMVQAADLCRLIERWQRSPDAVVASRHGGVMGVPAVLPCRLFPPLVGLTGDRGARALISGDARKIAIELPAAAFDVDTPEDILRAPRP